MAGKKEKTDAKKTASKQPKAEEKLLNEHPYETMSQIQNRYGKGREHGGSDGTVQDGRGSDH